MNTSSLKSSNGISETRESCQQLSHQRRGPACSLAIIVPPWIVNPAERPSEIITAPRDVATARGATRRSIYKTTHLPPRKKTLSTRTNPRILPSLSSPLKKRHNEEGKEERKEGRRKRRRRRIKILDPVQAKRLKGQPLLFPAGFRATTVVIKEIERNNGDYVVTIDRAEARDQPARWKSMSHAANILGSDI